MPWNPNGVFTKQEYRLLQAQQWRARNKQRMAELYQRWKAANPERVRELGRKWRAENPERVAEHAKAYRKRRPEVGRAAQRQRYSKRKLTDPDFQARRTREYRARTGAAADKAWKAANRAAYAEYSAARRAGLSKATPPWVDRAELKRIYEFAADMGMQVDHIHPLKGRNFCGLHVPWNLQLLTATENAAKGNRLQDT